MEKSLEKLEELQTSMQVKWVEKQLHDFKEIRNNSVSSQQLSLIWDIICTSDNVHLPSCCCSALVGLVRQGFLDADHLLDHLFSLLASAKSVQWLVKLVTKILLLKYELTFVICEKCGYVHYEAVYNFTSKPHPYLVLLKFRKDAMKYIVYDIKSMLISFTINSPRKMLCGGKLYMKVPSLLALLKPIIVHVCCTSQDCVADNQLISDLIGFCSPSDVVTCCNQTKEGLFSFISSLAPFAKSERFVCLLVQMANVIRLHYDSDKHIIGQVCSNLFRACEILIEQNCALNVGSCLTLLGELLQHGHMNCKVFINLVLNLPRLIIAVPTDLKYSVLTLMLVLVKSSSYQKLNDSYKLMCIYVMKVAVLWLQFNKSVIKLENLNIFHILQELENELQCIAPCMFKESCELSIDDDSCGIYFADVLLSVTTTTCLNEQSVVLKCSPTGPHSIQSKTLHHICSTYSFYLGSIITMSTWKDCKIDESLYCKALDTLKSIYQFLPDTALSILPVLLHSIKLECNIMFRNKCLDAIADMVSNRFCIAPILNFFHNLANGEQLLPLSIRLMLKVCRLQPRCFPYLLSLTLQISDSLNVKTAVLFATREICRVKGGPCVNDVLKLLISMLKLQLDEEHIVMLLDTLHYISINEDIDIVTIWSGIQHHIRSFKQKTVTHAILRYFSMVPSLQRKNHQIEIFQDYVLSWIWKMTLSPDFEIAGDAYVALSHFKQSQFKVKHIPMDLIPMLQKEETFDTNMADEIVEHGFLTSLIHNSRALSLSQKQFCLGSLICQEIDDLPQDINHRAYMACRKTTSNPLSAVPSFLMKLHNRNKHPNLTSPIATALLVCQPLPQLDYKDMTIAKARKHRTQLLQLLEQKLSQVSIDNRDWRSMWWLLKSWLKFMESFFNDFQKARFNEVNQDEENVSKSDEKLLCARYWCRNEITELLQKVSSGTPSMQGNALLCLSALMVAINSSKSSNNETKVFGYLSDDKWLVDVSSVFLSIIRNHYSSHEVLHINFTGENVKSQLGKICAFLSLTNVTLILLTIDVGKVKNMLYIMQEQIKSQNVETFSCITLGYMIALLYTEKANDRNESIAIMLQQAVELLKSKLNELFDSGEDKNAGNSEDAGIGALVGLAFVVIQVPSIYLDASSFSKQLKEQLLLPNSINVIQNISLVLSWLNSKLPSVNIVDSVNFLCELSETYPNNRKICTALSLLRCRLEFHASKESKHSSNYDEMFKISVTIANNEHIPLKKKVAAVSSLAALVGAESLQLYDISDGALEIPDHRLSSVVSTLQKLVRNNKDVAVSSCSTELLARIYLSCNKQTNTSQEPSSYSYLPKPSVLCPLINDLKRDIVKGKTKVDGLKLVLGALRVACRCGKVLPPIELASVLKHWLLSDDKYLQLLCLKVLFLLHQSVSIKNTISTLMEDAYYARSDAVRELFFQNLGILLQIAPAPTLKKLLNDSNMITNETQLHTILKQIWMSQLTPQVSAMFCEFLHKIYHNYPLKLSSQLSLENWQIISIILIQFQDNKDFNSMTPIKKNVLKSFFVNMHLISKQLKPIGCCLEQIIELNLLSENEQMMGLVILELSFHSIVWGEQDFVAKHLSEWLIELMELISKKINEGKATNMFYLKIFSCALCTLAGENMGPLYPGRSGRMEGDPETNRKFLWLNCIPMMLQIIPSVFRGKYWDCDPTYLITWLHTVHDATSHQQTKLTLFNGLGNLRRTSLFCDLPAWLNVVPKLICPS